MKPTTPVFPGRPDLHVTEFAKTQPQYITLPAYRHDDGPEGRVTTRWRLSWGERLRILLTGDLWLAVLTFGERLQPVKLSAHCPEEPDLANTCTRSPAHDGPR